MASDSVTRHAARSLKAGWDKSRVFWLALTLFFGVLTAITLLFIFHAQIYEIEALAQVEQAEGQPVEQLPQHNLFVSLLIYGSGFTLSAYWLRKSLVGQQGPESQQEDSDQ